MRVNTYVKPKNVKEAYDLLMHSGNQIIGGGCWLKILPKEIETAIDLSECELNYITETDDLYEIGSYVTLRKFEDTASIKTYNDGILSKSIGEVMSVPFRNVATIGGTVAGKFGFSDIITALLVLDTELIFFSKGKISLENYLKNKSTDNDILTGLRIKKVAGKGYYYTLKKTANDFPIINIAIVKNKYGFKISVGSRPSVAMLAKETMAYLNANGADSEATINKASEILINEIQLGSNTRGSKEYREAVIKGLLQRGLKEVNR